MSDYGTPPPPPPPPPPEGQDPGSAPGMPSMPGYAGPAGAPGPVARPASIAMAVKLMYVGAALSLLTALSSFLARDTIRDAVQKASNDSATPLTASQIDAAVTFSLVMGVVSGIIAVALWLWMASANGKGRKWARIVATVFFGLSVLVTLGSLVRPQASLSLVLNIVSVLLGAYIIVLLFRRESTEYYTAQSTPR